MKENKKSLMKIELVGEYDPESEKAAEAIGEGLDIVKNKLEKIGVKMSIFEILAYGLAALDYEIGEIEGTKATSEIIEKLKERKGGFDA